MGRGNFESLENGARALDSARQSKTNSRIQSRQKAEKESTPPRAPVANNFEFARIRSAKRADIRRLERKARHFEATQRAELSAKPPPMKRKPRSPTPKKSCSAAQNIVQVATAWKPNAPTRSKPLPQFARSNRAISAKLGRP